MNSVSAILTNFGQFGNISNLARDMFDSHFNVGSNFIHNYSMSTMHPPSIILDAEITNNEATVQTVYIDGVALQITSGSTKSMQNIPFVEFRANGNIDIVVAGIYFTTLERLTGKRS